MTCAQPLLRTSVAVFCESGGNFTVCAAAALTAALTAAFCGSCALQLLPHPDPQGLGGNAAAVEQRCLAPADLARTQKYDLEGPAGQRVLDGVDKAATLCAGKPAECSGAPLLSPFVAA